ncbi:MAG TPA: FAD-dependent oxidoreductase [Streptosporangiaceae bacterium]|nr:FAD-dependent oxidoreductase [Streptosporangiaceae bacterium]
MASIIVCGGGVIGLSAATMLARDRHQVTVLEADGGSPPSASAAAWEDWQRRGVGHVRNLTPPLTAEAERDTNASTRMLACIHGCDVLYQA